MPTRAGPTGDLRNTASSSEPFDDGGVGHAGCLTHGLEAAPPTRRLDVVEQGGEQPPDRDLARWVIRPTLSLLAVHGADSAEKRRLVERFLALT